jgi:hypothetical protein
MQSADMKDLHETNIDWIFKSLAPADGIRAAIKSMPCLSNIQGWVDCRKGRRAQIRPALTVEAIQPRR